MVETGTGRSKVLCMASGDNLRQHGENARDGQLRTHFVGHHIVLLTLVRIPLRLQTRQARQLLHHYVSQHCLVLLLNVQRERCLVPTSVSVHKVGGGPIADNSAVDHDGDLVAERLCFVHAMGRH